MLRLALLVLPLAVLAPLGLLVLAQRQPAALPAAPRQAAGPQPLAAPPPPQPPEAITPGWWVLWDEQGQGAWVGFRQGVPNLPYAGWFAPAGYWERRSGPWPTPAQAAAATGQPLVTMRPAP